MRRAKQLFCITMAIVFTALCFSGCASKDITGNEWLLKQSDCFNDLREYANGMDQVYTLYFIGSITPEDFSAELNLLNQQYKILNAFYRQMQEENPVKEGSHTYVSKRGTDAVETLYRLFGDVLANSVDGNSAPIEANQLAYIYLAYKQQIEDNVATYITAVTWLKEANGELTNAPGTEESTEKESEE